MFIAEGGAGIPLGEGAWGGRMGEGRIGDG